MKLEQSYERVMFLPDNVEPCPKFILGLYRTIGCAPFPCQCQRYHGWDQGMRPSALGEVLKSLSHAREEVIVCMYLFTHKLLADFLKYLKHKRKIRMYILTDNKYARLEGNQAKRLSSAGINCKYSSTDNMHNKYCIVDRKVMIHGSANWTAKAFSKNEETITWSNNWNIIEPTVKKFFELFRAADRRV